MRLRPVGRWVLLLAAGAAAPLAGGCSARPTVTQWAQSSGVVALDNTVVSDVNGIIGATKAGKPSSLIVTICDALYSDANQAYDSVLPSPNTALTAQLADAYVDLQNGAQDCSTSVGGSSAAASAHAYQEINTGSHLLQSATRHLASLGVH